MYCYRKLPKQSACFILFLYIPTYFIFLSEKLKKIVESADLSDAREHFTDTKTGREWKGHTMLL